MKKFRIYIYAFVIAGMLASCGNTKGNSTSPKNDRATSEIADAKTQASSIEIDSSTEVKIYRPSRTIYTRLIHTRLELTPIWEKSQMKGIETLTASPYFYPSDSLILDAKAMIINSVKLNGNNLVYSYTDNVLKIKLDKTYHRNESYTVVIDYLSRPEEIKSGGSAAIQDDKGLYFINPLNEKDGFMPQIWTQGETEANSVWFPTIDSPNMKSSGEIYLTVDKKYKTLSNGKLSSSVVNADGTRTDHYVQEKPISMYLYMIAVGEFDVIHDFYTKVNGEKLAVDYYVEPKWKSQAKAIFGNTPEMLKFYNDILGIDYPWDKFSQIIVREYVSGAMENVGAVVFGDFMYRDSSELVDGKIKSDAVIAHELFHHWFGDLVTTESWSNLTVNESFANYSEYLWNEYKYGLDVAQYVMEDTKAGYYHVYPTHDLVWFYYDHPDDMFDGISYNKGGAILNQLRSYVGDDAFFKSLNLYLTRHQYGTAEAHNLRMAFEEVTGEDLNWYFNEWYYGKGHPEVKIQMKQNKEDVLLTFDQTQSKEFGVFTIPMTIAYTDDKGEQLSKFKITQKNQSYTLKINGKLQRIVIDPDKTLLGHYDFDHSDKQLWMNQFTGAKNYNTKKEAIEHLFQLFKNEAEIKAFADIALDDKFYGTQIQILQEITQALSSSQIEMKGNEQQRPIAKFVNVDKVKQLANNGKEHELRSQAIQLYLLGEDTPETKIDFLKSLAKTEKSYNVLATILEGLTGIDPSNSDKYTTEFAEKHPSTAINFALADYYLSNHKQGKMDFYKNLYTNSKLRDKGNALMYLGYYSFSTGIDEMSDFVHLVDSVYDNSFHFKKSLASMMVQAKGEISHYIVQMEESLKGKKQDNSDQALFLLEMKNIEKELENVIQKHKMNLENN